VILRGLRAKQHQQLAEVLHRRGIEGLADGAQQRFPGVAVVAEHAHLDELVRGQRNVDLLQDGGREAVLADGHDRIEVMRTRTQGPPRGRIERCHGGPQCSAAAADHRGFDPDLPTPIFPGMPSPLNRAGRKHRFGKAWMHEHVTDPYVQLAQRRGYRSRAAFKLLELDEKDDLLRRGIVAVDLGSAPGSWSQVLRERLGPHGLIVATDILPMDGLAGVRFVEADFTGDTGLAAVERALEGRRPDLVVSDMAPNLSGIDAVDQARSIHLAELALEFAVGHLQPGGDFAVKVFQGAGLAEFERAVRARFAKVHLRKPKASRDRSRELFLVAKGFRPSSPEPHLPSPT
jgi:23S rRNA (uridine2552-2'-O)-methyltransferase